MNSVASPPGYLPDFVDKHQLRAIGNGKRHTQALARQILAALRTVSRAAILEMQPVLPPRLKPIQQKSVRSAIRRGTAEGIHHSSRVLDVVVLYAVPVHAVRPR